MFRLTQIVRNFFIRLEGLLYQLFGFLKKILDRIGQFFSYLGKLLGLTDTPYFMETDPGNNVKATEQVDETTKTAQDSSVAASSIYRRPDPKMEEFRKMAQQANKSRHKNK